MKEKKKFIQYNIVGFGLFELDVLVEMFALYLNLRPHRAETKEKTSSLAFLSVSSIPLTY